MARSDMDAWIFWTRELQRETRVRGYAGLMLFLNSEVRATRAIVRLGGLVRTMMHTSLPHFHCKTMIEQDDN